MPEIKPGTIRIKTSNLEPYEKTGKSWKKSSKKFPEAIFVIRLFKTHNNFDILIDKKNPRFLKGQLSPENKIQGARIGSLPDGKKLDKAFSLFARNLTIHDEASNDHWDVIYQNPGGTYSYLYTLEKRKKAVRKKYKVVKEFTKLYPRLKRNIHYALQDKGDDLALPMYTLLKTHMRVGNEIYYNINGHIGLSTLKKKNISIEGRYVLFSYKAKDGVPRKFRTRFPKIYILRLQKKLKSIKKVSFVFINKSTGNPLHDNNFKKAFKQYCGKEFYPHIVRSYYATSSVNRFLRTRKSATKEEIRILFLTIAKKLGHKRFVKKDKTWRENYNVTINHYIKPELIKKVKAFIK